MADTPINSLPQEDMLALSQNWLRLSGKAQQLMSEFWVRQLKSTPQNLTFDPVGLMQTWTQLGTSLLNDPERLISLQQTWWQDNLKLLQSFTPLKPDVQPGEGVAPIKDKRFSAKEWSENALFDFIRQSYLLSSKYVNEFVAGTQDLDPKEKAKAEFYTRQFTDALSPANFLLTNPQALQATLDTGGQNLIDGLENLISDLEQGRISMTDYSAFEVGKNVAVTPGKVVFENRLFQLIHYTPTQAQVYETPILFFPPWINKFYILDLTPEKSMVKWLLDEGFSVLMVSWINPDSSYRDTSFEDYMQEGLIQALEAALAATNAKQAHVVGYCVAGTALAATLAYLKAKKREKIVKTATFFTAQVDFSEAGELCIFVDDKQLETVDALSAEAGYLDASYMATTFNMLRANDLIWSYVVNNYLLGKDPFPFDLLYWNSDSTRLPRAMHLWYLSHMYRDNKLVVPGGVTLGGVPIDLTSVKTPTYIQAGKEDHIAPARSSWKITEHFSGPKVFMLAGSGHIAGVINPPAQHKYQYWTNDDLSQGFAGFIATATEHKGSWWPHWVAWLAPQSGKKITAPQAGEGKFAALEAAPGRYVTLK
jgi:polyhydroxyalkanoate synthase subunit PhaC